MALRDRLGHFQGGARSDPSPAPTAQQRWVALTAEQAEIHATLAELRAHELRAQRSALLLEDGRLDEVRDLASADESLRLRLEQLALRLPGIEIELEAERLAAVEAAWQARRPQLVEAEAGLADAITNLKAALAHAHAVYGQAHSFGPVRMREFIPLPPPEMWTEYVLLQFVHYVERRRSSVDDAAA